MEFWAKFYTHIFRHPKVKAFRPGLRCKALEFVALSLDYGAPGVVSLYDDEIRAWLGMSLEGWLSLRDLMLLRGLIRQLPGPNDGYHYEVAFWLLPEQAQDARRREAWSEPDLLSSEPIRPHARPGAASPDRKEAMTGGERKALFDERRRCLKSGLPLPDRAAFLAAYRAQKESALALNPGSETVTEIGNVTQSNSQSESIKRKETDNSSSPSSRNEINPGNETEAGNETTGNSLPSGSEKAVVVAFLSETGVPLPEGETVLLSRKGAEACVEAALRAGDPGRPLRQAEWLPYRKPPTRGEWGGVLRTAILENWPCPEAYRIKMREKKERERHQAEQRRCAEAAQARQAAEKTLADRLADYWRALTPEQQETINGLARERLSAIHRQQLRKREEAGQEPGPLLLQTLEAGRSAILREQSGLTAA